MKQKIILLGIVGLAIILSATSWMMLGRKFAVPPPTTLAATEDPTHYTSVKGVPSSSQSTEPATTPNPVDTSTPASSNASGRALYYPMTRYAQRILNRDYGQLIEANDNASFPCGDQFTGFHTGDDLEVTSTELKTEVPVYAIADGTVRQAGMVDGYGGLIVIEHQIEGQSVTAYYGHVNVKQTSIETGAQVKAGQQITILGEGCSADSSLERKHLHFDIHRGTKINVKGYVETAAELAAWINPKQLFERLSAISP